MQKKAAIVLLLIGLVLYLYKLATSPEEASIWRLWDWVWGSHPQMPDFQAESACSYDVFTGELVTWNTSAAPRLKREVR